MSATADPSWRERLRARLAERGAAAVLAIAIELLIALALLFALAPGLQPKKKVDPPIFGFDVDDGEPVEPKDQSRAAARPKGGAQKAAQVPAPRPPIPEPEVEAPATTPDPRVLWLSRRDYAATDVSRGKAPGNEAPSDGAAAAGQGTANDSELAQGSGPNGEPLYKAEWHREPTNAELSPFIPQRAGGRQGWGVIACRTAANYRVEDCVELADSPRGSGYAGAVRQAAFQFRVRPPRKGGKSLVGAWVSIRITYTFTRE